MPSSSKKQHNFMAAIAHSPSFAKKVGVPQSVGQDFNKADKGRKFSKGGDMAKFDPKSLFKGKESMGEELKEAKAIKSGKITPMQYAKGEKSEPMKKMAKGGMPAALAKHAGKPASVAHAGLKAGGMTKMAKGGGIETKGKTKGTMIKMKSGGRTC
jgi:hypothetical protein